MKLVIHLKRLFLIRVCMLIIVCIFASMSLSEMGMTTVSYLCYGVTLLSFFSLSVAYLYEQEMSRYGFLVFIFLSMLLSATIINAQEIKGAIYTVVEIACVFLLFKYYKKRMSVVVIGSTIGMSICVYANFLHMLAHPELWSFENEKFATGYLLGNNYNQLGCRMITAILCSILCLKYSKWWMLNVIPVVLCCILPLAIIRSMTSLSCICWCVVV